MNQDFGLLGQHPVLSCPHTLYFLRQDLSKAQTGLKLVILCLKIEVFTGLQMNSSTPGYKDALTSPTIALDET